MGKGVFATQNIHPHKTIVVEDTDDFLTFE